MMKMETSMNLRRTDNNKISMYELRYASSVVFKSHRKTKEWEHDFSNEVWFPVKSDMGLTIPDLMANINFMIDDYEKRNIDFEISIYKRETEEFWHNITNVNKSGIIEGKASKYINLDYDYDEGCYFEESEDDEVDEFFTLKQDIIRYLKEKKNEINKLESLVNTFSPESRRLFDAFLPMTKTISEEKQKLDNLISRLSE